MRRKGKVLMINRIAKDLHALGVRAGDTILVHSSLKSLFLSPIDLENLLMEKICDSEQGESKENEVKNHHNMLSRDWQVITLLKIFSQLTRMVL